MVLAVIVHDNSDKNAEMTAVGRGWRIQSSESALRLGYQAEMWGREISLEGGETIAGAPLCYKRGSTLSSANN